MILKSIRLAWLAFLLMPLPTLAAETLNAAALVENSFKYMRGNASIATVVMTIHRPDWERKMTDLGPRLQSLARTGQSVLRAAQKPAMRNCPNPQKSATLTKILAKIAIVDFG